MTTHRKPFFVAAVGNVKVPCYVRQQTKNGKTYTSYSVPDHSAGKRKLRCFADPKEAKERARAIAEAVASGKVEFLNDADKVQDWQSSLRPEILKALEAVEPSGMTILPASQLLAQAVKILNGRSNELLLACQYWMQHRPDKPVAPKLVKDAVPAYLLRRTNLSARRQRNLGAQLGWFMREFGETPLHEVTPQAVRDFMDGRKWAVKTRNEFLGAVSLLFKEGQFNNWVPKDYNATKGIVREKVKVGRIGIFEPAEVRQLFARLAVKAPELVPFMALWCFSGIRKEEISRLSWPQVNRGLLTGYIEVDALDAKTGDTRNVPVLDNLRAWLTVYNKEQGKILPAVWLQSTKSAPDRLSELVRHICRKTKTVWKSNAPRHSYGTYHFKVCKDPGVVVSAMGNSLEKFQKHYWSKGKNVTDEAATEYFSIVPRTGNVVVLEKAVGE